ncbi:TlpA disulfide reductase family protein [Mucilaginibacter sp. AK015]|uniref:TlpA family protein disulfide reductase n=1 Tax=Mucilaginibacter sp. AK015 TaxID=2723072 RepID=UPI00161333E5|nr:TlpA disulfide reductase family protein [Mucilaginibacter sp. AK015]MBB5396678.1 thiol-disulfide isomerase/thioredoxin [Mucilaginibacter sp. AK015]
MKRFFLILGFWAQVILVKGQSTNVSISGRLTFLKDIDTIKVEIYKYGYRFADVIKKVDTIKVTNKSLSFKCSAYGNQTYIRLIYPSFDPQFFLIRPGDQINITNSDGLLIFTGKGAKKYNVQAVLNKMELQFLQNHSNSLTEYDSFIPFFKSVDSLSVQMHNYLVGQSMSKDKSYRTILADVDNFPLVTKYHAIHFLKDWYEKAVPTGYSAIWKKYLLASTDKDKDVSLSQNFTNYIYVKFQADCVLKNIPFSKGNFFSYILNDFRGIAREKLLIFFLNKYRGDTTGALSNWIDQSIAFITTPDFKNWVSKLRQNTPGAKVSFSNLSDTSGRLYTSNDFKGKVLVLDFWFTGCGNCVQLLPYLKKVENQFTSNDKVMFVSISTDQNKTMWQSSVKRGTYSSSESLNLYTGGRGWNDHLVKQLQVSGAPTLKIIDKDGKLFENPIDCRTDGGKDLIEKINKALAKN